MCPNVVQQNATRVTGEVHLNHHLQDATDIQKIEQISKCFCFYKLQTYHSLHMEKQYLTEHAIIFLEKSSGLSWNYPHTAGGVMAESGLEHWL